MAKECKSDKSLIPTVEEFCHDILSLIYRKLGSLEEHMIDQIRYNLVVLDS